MKVLFISFLILLIDQGTKLYVKGFSFPLFNINHAGLQPGESSPIISDLLHLTLVENPGFAFGIDIHPEFKIFFSLFTIAASVALVIYLFTIKSKNSALKISVAIIIGGAFGNLIDRMFYGYVYGYGNFLAGKVVDFLDIRVANAFLFNNTIGIYVFNIADLAITIGAVFLVVVIARNNSTHRLLKQNLNAQEEIV